MLSNVFKKASFVKQRWKMKSIINIQLMPKEKDMKPAMLPGNKTTTWNPLEIHITGFFLSPCTFAFVLGGGVCVCVFSFSFWYSCDSSTLVTLPTERHLRGNLSIPLPLSGGFSDVPKEDLTSQIKHLILKLYLGRLYKTDT